MERGNQDSDQDHEVQTPRPSVEVEAVISRELSKVGGNATTEEVKKALPESHRSADDGIGMPIPRRSKACEPLLLGETVGDASGETGIPGHYGK
jgi:hypothetical protein